MGILSNLGEELKNAMRSKDTVKLESLRAIKSAVLLAQTASGGSADLSDEEAIKLLQRLVKQRKDSAALYKEQNRTDLAEPEEAQAEIIEAFLPTQLSAEELAQAVNAVIQSTGTSGMQDMGKVMGVVSKQLAGKAEGKRIAEEVKKQLGA
ncbi:MAG: GatB/YqeY domain-containing protein [Flavobacteriaceae bacterium]